MTVNHATAVAEPERSVDRMVGVAPPPTRGSADAVPRGDDEAVRRDDRGVDSTHGRPGPAPTTAASRPGRPRPSVASRAGRGIVEGALTFFAVWTLCYQVALAARIPSMPTFVAAVVLWLLAVVLLVRRPVQEAGRPLQQPPRAAIVVLAVAVTGIAFGLGVSGHRALALDLGLVMVAAYLVRQWRARRHGDAGDTTRGDDLADTPRDDGSAVAERRTPSQGPLWAVGWLLALVSGALASVLNRPGGDDAFFVNLSVWVAQKGTFPLRDTMLSDQVFPGLQVHTPNVSSIEALFGVLAALTGVPAGVIVYLVVPPALTVLTMLGLTWLVEEARIPAAPFALVAAVVSMWMSGAETTTFGNFPLGIWQGKIILAATVIPLLYVTGMRLMARRRLVDHLLFGSAVIASVGASNTAVFLTPVLILGLVLAAVATRGVRAAIPLAAWVPYPLAVGLVIAVTVPPSPTPAELASIGYSDPGHPLQPLFAVPGRPLGIFIVTVVVVGVGWLGIRDRLMQAAVLGGVAATAIFVLPPVQHLAVTVGGIGAVVWRIWWVVPAPLLAAGVVGAGAVTARSLPRPLSAAVVLVTGAALALAPLVHGRWVGSPASEVHWSLPTTWKVVEHSLPEAQLAVRVSKPGDTILAPWSVSRMLADYTVDVHPVSARSFYLPNYLTDPRALVARRLELQAFADSRTPPASDAPRLKAALDAVGVDTICLGDGRPGAVRMAKSLGFHVVGSVDQVICLRR